VIDLDGENGIVASENSGEWGPDCTSAIEVICTVGQGSDEGWEIESEIYWGDCTDGANQIYYFDEGTFTALLGQGSNVKLKLAKSAHPFEASGDFPWKEEDYHLPFYAVCDAEVYVPTSSPTPRPTASPTSSPTPSPTVSPTPPPTVSPTSSPTRPIPSNCFDTQTAAKCEKWKNNGRCQSDHRKFYKSEIHCNLTCELCWN